MKPKNLLFLALLTIFVWAGCDEDNPSSITPGSGELIGIEELILSEEMIVNPSGYAPLTAVIKLQTDLDTRIRLRVVGKNGPDSDVVHEPEQTGIDFEVPVLGLYPDFENEVEVTFFETGGTEIGTKTYVIPTDPLIEHLPNIDVEVAGSGMAEGMTLVSYFGYSGDRETNANPQRPFIFDKFGDVRWYLDYSSHDTLSTLFFDNGVERLQNGNFYFGDRSTGRIYEINMFGEVLDAWEMSGYGFHHNVEEKPNGNFLVTVEELGAETVEDIIIEINRDSKEIINEWDLKESLDYERTAWTTDREDWIHVNALTYDENDNTIIVSGRTQGVIKLTEDNEVVWILGPHEGWGESGNGVDLNQFLLQPLDANDQPITDTTVINGQQNHADFEWNWYQHAPEVMPNGNVILFDNGDNRNYTGETLYSRAVEYAIDAETKTVKQVWSYGKERGAETFSRIVSDVDYLPEERHVIFSPGAIGHSGKIVEVDYEQQQVLFEATITNPQEDGIAFHRAERLSIYPKNSEDN